MECIERDEIDDMIDNINTKFYNFVNVEISDNREQFKNNLDALLECTDDIYEIKEIKE
jgi:hypothetical protein